MENPLAKFSTCATFVLSFLVMASCNSKDDVCATHLQCQNYIQGKIKSNLKLPDGGEEFGALNMYLVLNEAGDAVTYQYLPTEGNDHLAEPLFEAVLASSPFKRAAPKLKTNYDEYRRYDLRFYDYRIDQIFSGNSINIEMAIEYSEILKLLKSNEIENFLGKPDTINQCVDIYGNSHVCWHFRDKAMLKDASRGDLTLLLDKNSLYGFSASYPEQAVLSQSPTAEPDYSALESQQRLISEYGLPHVFVLSSQPGALQYHYFNSFKRGDRIFPGLRVYYHNGKFENSSFMLP